VSPLSLEMMMTAQELLDRLGSEEDNFVEGRSGSERDREYREVTLSIRQLASPRDEPQYYSWVL
jgi:hypothetical protein